MSVLTARTVHWYTARCTGCQPPQGLAFTLPEGRQGWVDEHAATGHTVQLGELVATDMGEVFDQLQSDPSDLPNPLGLPTDLREALESLRLSLALSDRKWADTREDAWLWGILQGWECPGAPLRHEDACDGTCDHAGGALHVLTARYGLSAPHIEALRRYSAAIMAACGEFGATADPEPAEDPEPIDTHEQAAAFLAGAAAQSSPRYDGPEDGILLLQQPGLVEHAYKAAQQANPHGGADYIAKLTTARNMLRTKEADQ